VSETRKGANPSTSLALGGWRTGTRKCEFAAKALSVRLPLRSMRLCSRSERLRRALTSNECCKPLVVVGLQSTDPACYRHQHVAGNGRLGAACDISAAFGQAPAASGYPPQVAPTRFVRTLERGADETHYPRFEQVRSNPDQAHLSHHGGV